ncbi:MAG: VirB8/TrbF family protein [Steroidobacteraceae bacterium]
MSKDAMLEGYFREATAWDADRVAMQARSARLAWIIAISACVLTVVAILALMLLMPLKRVEPFVIRVDNSTGIVDVVPVFAGQAEFPEAVTRYFLTHYVTTCERFNFATAADGQTDRAGDSGAGKPSGRAVWLCRVSG